MKNSVCVKIIAFLLIFQMLIPTTAFAQELDIDENESFDEDFFDEDYSDDEDEAAVGKLKISNCIEDGYTVIYLALKNVTDITCYDFELIYDSTVLHLEDYSLYFDATPPYELFDSSIEATSDGDFLFLYGNISADISVPSDVTLCKLIFSRAGALNTNETEIEVISSFTDSSEEIYTDRELIYLSSEDIGFSSEEAPTTSVAAGTTKLDVREENDMLIATITILNISSITSYDFALSYDSADLNIESYHSVFYSASGRFDFYSNGYSDSHWNGYINLYGNTYADFYTAADVIAFEITFSKRKVALTTGTEFSLTSTVYFPDGSFCSSEDSVKTEPEKIHPSTHPTAIRSGDVNGDKKITSADARLILRLSVGLDKCSEKTKQYADLNGDEEITAADARLALRCAVKLEKLSALCYFIPLSKNEDDDFGYYYDLDISYLSMKEGEKQTLNDVIVRQGEKVGWKSSNPSVVSVDKNGAIKAVKKGFACIIMTCGEDTFYYEVTVTSKLQEKIYALQKKYPDGYYWNKNKASKKYPNVSEIPCTDHSTKKYSKCKGQCAGFADLLSSEVFGNAKKSYGVTWKTVKIGDYLRLKPHHSVFVTDVIKKGDVIGYDYYEGKNITSSTTYIEVAHCNWYRSCDITWATILYADGYTIDSSLSYTRY